jgi:primosomal protein N' (replication factor Y)
MKWLRQAAPVVAHKEVVARWGKVQPALKALEEKGLITSEMRERYRTPLVDDGYEISPAFELTMEQAAALKDIVPAIDQQSYASFLLRGVTGSGKTEVYIRAIEATLKGGRGALVLVPEIALTPQFIALFMARFGSRIAQIHSGLSRGERYDEWRRIRNGKARIVIGARSAIFSPVKNLGIIVVDEEHDSAYKQDQRFCYHARDLALVRGKMSDATVILGSATPMMETYHNTQVGKLQYLPLDQRIDNKPLPRVAIVDMRNEKPGTMLSSPLREAISQRWKRGEQTLLFLNRRGFARFVLCRKCGYTFQCPNCAVSLVYHQKDRFLRCHYCNHAAGTPKRCPECHSSKLSVFGFGTERLEAEVRKHFPGLEVGRLDRDTVARKDALRSILKRFRQGKTELLIGTQMIALGHDLPGVTLVGIVAADVSLNLPDFRAGERTFQLFTQVAGRSGRGTIPGKVIIQTYNPSYSSIQQAIRQDFLSFYQQEVLLRKELGYPPFSRLVNVRIVGRDRGETSKCADALGRRCRELLQKGRRYRNSLEILGPAEAPWEKLKGKYRWQLLLKGKNREDLQGFTHAVVHSVAPQVKNAGVTITVDVDPVNLL